MTTRLEIAYYPNGQKHFEENYLNDVLHGAVKAWHSNGMLAVRASFVDGRLHGTLSEYDKYGNLEFEAYYLNGVEISSGVPLYSDAI